MPKIPKHAKKVFTGVMFDVYQWKQKLYDGSSATFEMLKRPDTVNAIAVTPEKKIVMAYQEQPDRVPLFTLFGGRREPGEDMLQTAERELLEESGMRATEWELLRTDEPSFKMDWTIYTYIARGCKKVSKGKQDAGEKIEIKEVSFEEFIRIVTEEAFPDKEFALDIFRKIKNNELESFKQFLLGK